MTYSNSHPVRLVGGRLAIDFLNTADWCADGTVAREWMESLADVNVWLRAVGLPKASPPRSIRGLHAFRNELRQIFLGQPHAASSELQAHLRRLRIDPEDIIAGLRREPALGLITLSALSILSDPKEMGRIKTCPGKDCGWMFLDETKNARRKWCAMELCGNRAKASRNYERRVRSHLGSR